MPRYGRDDDTPYCTYNLPGGLYNNSVHLVVQALLRPRPLNNTVEADKQAKSNFPLAGEGWVCFSRAECHPLDDIGSHEFAEVRRKRYLQLCLS